MHEGPSARAKVEGSEESIVDDRISKYWGAPDGIKFQYSKALEVARAKYAICIWVTVKYMLR